MCLRTCTLAPPGSLQCCFPIAYWVAGPWSWMLGRFPSTCATLAGLLASLSPHVLTWMMLEMITLTSRRSYA